MKLAVLAVGSALLTVPVFRYPNPVGRNFRSAEAWERYQAEPPETLEEFLKASSIDINRADSAELETISGIGKVLAARIIEYREQNGGFQRIEDVIQVKGIGPVKLAEISRYCYAGTESE